ncbi:cupin domain-containing protein [Treponema pectinovorum]|uniref:cupin domain-containing protein n=1 Tax=Treponema pectinovorum TaxID=164 RepID=UPI003D8C44E9
MRKIKILPTVLCCVSLFSCSSTKKSAISELDQNKSDCKFDFGTDVSAYFTGTAYIKNLIPLEDVYNFPETNVITFAPDSRSSWHVHGGMYIIGVGGVGLYQEEGKPAIIIRKGDVIQIPAGVRHWHGSTKNSWFQQIVVYDKNWQNSKGSYSHGDLEVTSEEFSKLTMIENPNRVKKIDSKLTFARAKKAIKFPTFNDKIYLSNVVEEKNEASSPGMHYVVFPKGVYNAWHSHEGGQILIVTDGIGYHQMSDSKVEILKVGDVVFCPPNKKHWHGASLYGTFAHIAINTNPQKSGVTWFEMMSEDDYKKITEETK